MTPPSHDPLIAERLVRRLPVACGALLLLAGLGRCLAGHPLNAAVSLTFALGCVVLGAALVGLGLGGPKSRLAGRALSFGGLALGLAGAGKIILPALVPGGWAGALRALPGTLPLGAAAAFILGGLALLGSPGSARPAPRAWSPWLAVGVLALALISLLAPLYGFPAVGLEDPIRMGWLPAAGLLLLGAGLLLLRPEDDFVGVFLGDTAVGDFARRLLLAVVLAPPLLLLARLHVLSRLPVGLPEESAVFSLVWILAGVFLLTRVTRIAGTFQQQRELAEAEQSRLLARLQNQAAGLQELVAARTLELEESNRRLKVAAQANQQLSLVASHTTSGVIIADAQGRIEWVNKAWEHMSGYALAEVAGHPPVDFLRGPEPRSTGLRRVEQAFVRGGSCYEEILSSAKDGRPYWQIIDIESVRNEKGETVNFIVVLTDITQYREAQQQLQQLNERLQLAVLASGYGVWEADVRSGRQTWDARMFELYGLPEREFDGSPESWLRCAHPGEHARARRIYADLISGKMVQFDEEYRIVRPRDKRERHIKSKGYLQRDEKGNPLRIVGLDRDVTAEREQREQLHASVERLQLALRASRCGVWDMDPRTGKIYWDQRMFEIYGVRPEDFNGTFRAWAALVHAEDRVKIEVIDQAAEDSGNEFKIEYRIIRPDGRIRHLETHGCLRRDPTGRMTRCVGMERDVTAEKEMQEALRMAEERWELALTGTNDGVWDWDIPSGRMYFNERYAEILGYELRQLPQDDRGWMALVHPDDLAATMAARESHVAGRTPLYATEHRMQIGSGEWKWVLGRGKVVARDPAGQARRMVGTLSDITERKQMEQILRRNQELATHVEKMALIGGWEYDPAYRKIYWSQSVRRIHEVPDSYDPDVEASHSFCAPEMRGVLQEAFQRCLAQGEPYDLELPLITAAGNRRWVRLLGRADRPHGRLVRIYGAYQDITTRHGAEEARRQLELQLFQAQKMDTLGTLAGGIAHDFNNLLTGIMGYHDLATDMLPEDHPVRGYLAESRQASLRARGLVEQILTFSRQQESAERMTLDLGLLVGEARRFLRATLPATIDIQADIADHGPRVLADSTQLHQVLLNLGSNGAQAMGERGGLLKIALRRVEMDASRATALGGLVAGRYACISVTDSGHGMDANTVKRIFDPFFTTKKPGEGTGLGLSVVHGIVRNHQGGIEVESVPGVGTTFHIFLPEAAAEAQAPQRPRPVPLPGQGDTIYLVDDEEIVAKFARIALERMGYKVVLFSSALPCLEAIRADPQACSLIITDQTMPGLTGTDLLDALHKINPRLGAVLMSGYFTKELVASLTTNLEHIVTLTKPFTTDELALAVQRALEHRPAGSAG
ncbi:MAG: PAS domain-containing protein [Opitutae bacterium]|nr:PAS domain-containing protein [Opitutae bacterium]